MAVVQWPGASSPQFDFPVPVYLDKFSFFNIQNEVKPLGIKTSNEPDDASQQEYYEVEVYADEADNVGELKKIDDILNTPTSKCHICNIDVPKSYIKEHIQSVKHENCREITNIALERTNLYIKAQIEQNLKVEVKDTYYCESCAIIVLNTDKESHILTKAHIKSVERDDLLQKLVEIYKNPVIDLDNFDSSQPESEQYISGSINEETDIMCFQSDVSEQQNTQSICSETMSNTSDSETNESCKDSNENSEAKDVSISPKVTEVQRDATVCDKEKDESINGETATETVKTPEKKLNAKQLKDALLKRNLIEEYTEELRSYLKIDTRTAFYKKVTVLIKALNGEMVTVPLENFHGFHITGNEIVCRLCQHRVPVNAEKHKLTPEHVAITTTPVEDRHCLKWVSKSLIHCMLCNTLVTSVKKHASSSLHIVSLRKYEEKQYLYPYVKRFIAKNNLTDNGNCISCDYCQIRVVRTKKAAIEHIYSMEHNAVEELSVDEWRCTLCDKTFSPDLLKTHCKREPQHKKHLRAYVAKKLRELATG